MKNKTTKYVIYRRNNLWPESFDTLEEAKRAVHVYNLEWYRTEKTNVRIEKVTNEEIWSN